MYQVKTKIEEIRKKIRRGQQVAKYPGTRAKKVRGGIIKVGIRPIKPTILDFGVSEYDEFMERFKGNISKDEQNTRKIREEFKKRRAAKGKKI